MSDLNGTVGISPDLLVKLQALVKAHEEAVQKSETVPEKPDLTKLFDELPEKGDEEVPRLKLSDIGVLENRIDKSLDICFGNIPILAPETSLRWKSVLEKIFEIYPFSKQFLLTEDYLRATGGDNKLLCWDFLSVSGKSDILQVMRCLDKRISYKAKTVNYTTGILNDTYYLPTKMIWDTVNELMEGATPDIIDAYLKDSVKYWNLEATSDIHPAMQFRQHMAFLRKNYDTELIRFMENLSHTTVRAWIFYNNSSYRYSMLAWIDLLYQVERKKKPVDSSVTKLMRIMKNAA
ncbi:hypothetical protein METSCH_B11000 [Metschnikowia aff. pulcherrima]|uniref:Uncharacterized protein n=1 Tax=Metschnikowia aff. pulcherrima TaxID=2163413 RepID=A0A4P6XNT6_9ASCO|nr:hypothetical protein METSCH_B11000 [Metschnikowia aff. pulcherrima]